MTPRPHLPQSDVWLDAGVVIFVICAVLGGLLYWSQGDSREITAHCAARGMQPDSFHGRSVCVDASGQVFVDRREGR